MAEENRRYLETHEWALLEGKYATFGLSEFAVKHLSDLVFVQLPEIGDKVESGESFGEIESVKAVSELNAPMTGDVVEINQAVAENLELVSGDPLGDGWLIKIRVDDASEFEDLLDADAYEKQIDEEEEGAKEEEEEEVEEVDEEEDEDLEEEEDSDDE